MKTKIKSIMSGITLPRALWLSRKLVAQPAAVVCKHVSNVVWGSVTVSTGAAAIVAGAITGTTIAVCGLLGGGVTVGCGMVAKGSETLRAATAEALNGYINKDDPCPAPRGVAVEVEAVPSPEAAVYAAAFPAGVHVATA